MRILLVEDDINKVAQISEVVRHACPQAEFTVRRSFQSGLREIIEHCPDILLLDMTMPNYDVGAREPGGKERRYAGREILRQIERRKLAPSVIVITQYEQFEENGQQVTLQELISTLHRRFATSFLGAVYYQAGSTDWIDELRRYLSDQTIGTDDGQAAMSDC